MTRTTPSRRALVIARYGLAATLRSRLLVAFLAACLMPSLGLLAAVYLRHNIAFVDQVADIAAVAALDLDAWLFESLLGIARAVTFLIVLIVGPGLVAPDLANNAMPLYWSRPVAKHDYVAGKLLVLLGLAMTVGVLPGLLLIGANAAYAGDAWGSGGRLAIAFAAALLVWALCLSLVALAISAWVKWRPAATLGLLGLYVVAALLGGVLDSVFGGLSGSLFDLGRAVQTISAVLAGVGEPAMPMGFACAVVVVVATLATMALWHRIGARA